ncbi:MAG: OsmC family protein [Planctomycetota bacterium]
MSAESPLPAPDAVCDGGDLDCGSGLLLIIRDAMQPLDPGGLLEVRSREISVVEDLPAWCRMVGHALLGVTPGEGKYQHFLIRKKGGDDADLATDLEAARSFEWRARIRWTEGMRARAYVRNHVWELGQPASFDTEDAAASAVEHLLAALAGCLAVGFQWRCSRAKIEVWNLEVTVRAQAQNVLVFLGIEDEGHPGLAKVVGKLYVDADADDATLQALWQETLRRSPVAQTLRRETPLEIELDKV